MLTDDHPGRILTNVIWSAPDDTARYDVLVVSHPVYTNLGRLKIVERRTGLCIWDIQIGINLDTAGNATTQDITTWVDWAAVIIKGQKDTESLYCPIRKRARA
jgi:hypothetical protein